MKKFLVSIMIGSILFTGCSSKYPAVKTGANIGGTAGVIAGGLLGAALSKSHPGNGDTIGGVLIVGVIFGLIGLGLGAGTGYIVDSIRGNDDEMREMIQSQNIQGVN